MAADDALWIFGYGSLIWRPDFDHAERRAAWVRGWSRQFWQGSTDHRGVPERPGRVVTLVRDADAVCRGMAFRVPAGREAAVLASLDHRERGGYERVALDLHFDAPAGPHATAVTYVATESNPHYLGPAPLEEIALQARTAVGPSGTNREYVLELARALDEIGAEDVHVRALAALLGADPARSA